MADEYINKKDVVDLGVMMQTHLLTREQTYNAIFCLPSADVAEVVRCKDCKHCEYASNRIPTEQAWVCYRLDIDVEQDWFCADGERKDND